ncbi:zinc finger protein 569-like isoform X2 [Ambystoma mexicanum]|uniref:zinc finger protein 569-like isoform X2 n=1 Tax=Ambystoma mexicanum TaxID=8296 RepID=UPI0037E85431
MIMLNTREGKASVTFHDVAAYFSEDEWKPLPEWQKEQYKNVMKEIHQALISLGHNILNRDTVLQIKKRDELHVWDPKYSERRAATNDLSLSSYPTVTPDIFLRIKQEENVPYKDGKGSNEMILSNIPIRGPSATSFFWKIKEEQEPCPVDQHNGEEKGMGNVFKTNDPVITSVFSLNVEHEEEMGLLKKPELKETAPSNPVITSVFSLNIKCEEETHFEKEIKTVGTATGFQVDKPACLGNLKYLGGTQIKQEPLTEGETASAADKRQLGDSARYTKNVVPYKDLSRKVKMEVFHSPEKTTNTGNFLWSGRSQQLGGTTDTKCSASKPASSNLHPKMELTDTYDENGGNLRNVGILTWVPDTPQMWRPFKCTECEAYFSLSEDLFKHEQTHPQQSSYNCNECKKRFVRKEDLATHQKIHEALQKKKITPLRDFKLERTSTAYLHQCMQCEKSFILKENLILHLRTHVHPKPFKCTKCEKSFNQHEIFIRHLKTHTEDKSYTCTCNDCGINFFNKLGLLMHQKRRLCKKSFPFPVYTKCFVLLGDRISLEEINDGKRKNTGSNAWIPYQCPECGGGFSRKVDFNEHGTHTE